MWLAHLVFAAARSAPAPSARNSRTRALIHLPEQDAQSYVPHRDDGAPLARVAGLDLSSSGRLEKLASSGYCFKTSGLAATVSVVYISHKLVVVELKPGLIIGPLVGRRVCRGWSGCKLSAHAGHAGQNAEAIGNSSSYNTSSSGIALVTCNRSLVDRPRRLFIPEQPMLLDPIRYLGCMLLLLTGFVWGSDDIGLEKHLKTMSLEYWRYNLCTHPLFPPPCL
ncbi:hypothetical protein ANO11243_093840 [Dothideomycetidae sp. 11243]|nr:hypothetical protein ANO11243_093840 [fungal sp. No.11243]